MRILFLPHTSWQTPQRFHPLTRQLSERHEIVVTDWDAEFRTVTDYLSLRYLMNYVPRRWRDGKITVYHVPRISPAIFSKRLRALNSTIYKRMLDRIIAAESIDVVVGTFPAPIVTEVPAVVDLFDDNPGLWQARGAYQAYTQEILESELAWIRQSRCVVTVSSVLEDKVRASFPGACVTHISNGVDLGLYRPDRTRARRDLGLSMARKYIGNIGSLDRKAEADRLVHVARALSTREDVRLLIVGRGRYLEHLNSEVGRLGLTNVDVVGFTSGRTLVNYFQAIDVGLCPYRVTEGDHARVPLRLLHYSAVGAGVVSAKLEEVTRMGFDNVLLCEDSDEAFVERVVEALERTFSPPAQIRDYDVSTLSARYEEVLQRVVRAAGEHAR